MNSENSHTTFCLFLETFPVVAFSVALVHNITVAAGSVVLYDHVFVNYKNSYDVTLGHFVAPASGLYEFNYHARSQQDSIVFLRLRQNQKFVFITSLFFHHFPLIMPLITINRN